MPSLDVWLLFLMVALAASVGKRLTIWAGLAACGFFLVLRVFRIGDTAVPLYLNRPFNLYIDSGYIFDLFDLLKTSARQGEFLILAVKGLVVTLGVTFTSWYAWRATAGVLTNRPLRNAFLGASVFIISALWIWGWPGARPPAMLRFGQEIVAIPGQFRATQAFGNRLEQAAKEREAGPASLQGLEGANVLLFMVESYGRTVFSRPIYRPAMEKTMEHFADLLDRHGFSAVSSFLVSPTYGGSSWLAHSTLESGLRVANDLEDNLLLHSNLPPIATYFRRSGYRTVSVMPGTRFSFPEGDYFGYEQVYYAHHFNYDGPSFGWAPMPDQYVLDWVRHREFVNPRRPLFVRYVLISTHAAYNIQPAFIADWNRIGDGSIYNEHPPVYYPIYWPDLKNAGEAYLRSLDYEFRTLGDYLARYVEGNALIIIMGDHQPNLQLTGTGESWSVPVHVISRNPRFLTAFAKRGYAPGLIPTQSPPHAGMETLLPGFLQDFR
ncbi:MAG: hypothetical protein P8X96_17275 [Desulfobacteraceae bacterium]